MQGIIINKHELCIIYVLLATYNYWRAIFIFSSKVSKDTLYECVNAVLEGSQKKQRNFVETVELQIALKNYDPQKDKRFSGTVKYDDFSDLPEWNDSCW